jgi:prephenate dehydratase
MTAPTEQRTVVYQGEPGAFSEEAVLAFFGEDRERVAVATWRAVFEAVGDGSADRGVIAIESSLAGTIRETYDLLSEF